MVPFDEAVQRQLAILESLPPEEDTSRCVSSDEGGDYGYAAHVERQLVESARAAGYADVEAYLGSMESAE